MADERVVTTGGGGARDGVETRVAVLATHMDYVRSDLTDIKAALAENSRELKKSSADTSAAIRKLSDDTSNAFRKLSEDTATEISNLSDKIKDLPTKKDLWEWRMQWTMISLAGVAIIIGGLDWLKAH